MNKLIDCTVELLIKNDPQIAHQRIRYEYGLNVFFSSFFNLLGILLIYLVLGYVKEITLMIIVFATLRTYVGGYHGKTRISCFLFFLGLSASVIWCYKSINFIAYQNEFFFGLIQCIIFIVVFAPMDTNNKRLSQREKRKYRKISIVMVISQTVIIIGLYILSYVSAAYIILLGIYATVFTMVVHLIQRVLKGDIIHEFKIN